jgi:hypothetical protein
MAAVALRCFVLFTVLLLTLAGKPTGMLVDYKPGPSHMIDSPRPILSWVAPHLTQEGFVDEGGQTQHSFQIQLDFSSNFSSAVLTSRVMSGASAAVEWPAPDLQPKSVYFWRLKVWTTDKVGNIFESEWSEPAKLVTGLFKAGFAKSTVPIWAAKADYALLRKVVTFEEGKNVTHAHAIITARQVSAGTADDKLLGAYRLYINGKAVGTGPGRGEGGDQATQYDMFDLSSIVATGGESCTIAIQGYNKGVGAVVMELQLTYSDGTTSTVGTDTTWLAYDATTLFVPTSNTGGDFSSCPREYIDANKAPTGDGCHTCWRNPTSRFEAGSGGWAAAVAQAAFPSTMASKSTLPISIFEGIEPVSIVELGPNHWFFDFGTDLMGGIQLEWTGETGYGINLRMGEELTANNSVLEPMRTGNKYEMTWTPATSSDSGSSSFEQHEYYLFRYGELKLMAPTPPPTPAQPTPSPFQTTTCIHLPPKQDEDQKAGFGCPAGEIITKIVFSSYGCPTGDCNKDGGNSFKINSTCSATSSVSAVSKECVGKNNCEFVASNVFFGQDPCHKVFKGYSGAVTCGKKSAILQEQELTATMYALHESNEGTFYTADAFNAAAHIAGESAYQQALPFKLKAWQVHYPWTDTDSSFESSNDMLNQVWWLSRNTMKVTSLDTTTDSNTRERRPYEADGYITGSAWSVYQREYMWNRHSTLFNFQQPTWPTEWRQTLPLLALADYMATGDIKANLVSNPTYYAELRLATQMACIDKTSQLVDFTNCKRESGTRDIIDWPTSARAGSILSDCSTVINAYAVGSMEGLAVLADAMSNMTEAGFLRAQAQKTREAMVSKFYTSKAVVSGPTPAPVAGLFVDGATGASATHQGWHAQTFGLYFNITPAVSSSSSSSSSAAAAATVPAVYDYLAKQGMVGSVYAAFGFVMGLYADALDFDHGKLALEILTTCVDNSWCHMIMQVGT